MQDSDDARAHFFYDVTFFIIITTVGLNIVFGIIVDTFSELRDKKVNQISIETFFLKAMCVTVHAWYNIVSLI